MRYVLFFAILVSLPLEASPSEEGFIAGHDGVKLYFRSFGRGPVTAIVPLVAWNMAAFEKRAGAIRFIFYDPRSRGRSETVSADRLGWEQDLKDLERVRAHFGLERMALIGTSYYGGLVALYAKRYPDRVSRLVMAGPISPRSELLFTYNPPEKQKRITEQERAHLEELSKAGANSEAYCLEYWRLENRNSVGPLKAANQFRDRCHLLNERPGNFFAWASALFASLGDWNWLDQAKQVQTPVLLIHGEMDLRTPVSGSEEWHAHLPNSRLLVVPEAGHVIWVDTPEYIFPAVWKYLMHD